MAVNISDAVKTAFGSLKSGVGQKLVGIFFIIQALNFGSTLLLESGSTGLQIAGGLITLAAAVISIAATIGGLRAFREGRLEKSLFTDNLLKPFFRIIGANLTIAAFAYFIGFIFLLPAFIAFLGGAGLSSVAAGSPSAITGASIGGIILGAIGLLLGVGAAIYVSVTLLLAQPLVAIEDKRMFQSLDESIQRTKGSRFSIFLTGVVIFLAYFITVMLGAVVSAVNEQAGAALIQLVIVPIFTPVFLSALNYFSEELPLE